MVAFGATKLFVNSLNCKSYSDEIARALEIFSSYFLVVVTAVVAGFSEANLNSRETAERKRESIAYAPCSNKLQ